MTFQQLLYVSETARLGSINKAAQALFVSQSTISSSIKDLETEFSIQLFIRTPSGISLSPDGQEFLSYARSLLDQKRYVEALFHKDTVRSYSRLTVLSQHLMFPVKAFIECLGELTTNNYEYTFREMDVIDIIDGICADKGDIGLIFLSEAMQAFTSRLFNVNNVEFHELCSTQPFISVRRDHPLAKQASVALKDLEPFPYLAFYQDSTTPFDHAEEVRLFFAHKPTKTIYTTDRGTLDSLLNYTDAYQICSGMSIQDYRTGNIVMRPLREAPHSIRMGWVKLRHKNLSTEAVLFLEKLSRLVTEYTCGAT